MSGFSTDIFSFSFSLSLSLHLYLSFSLSPSLSFFLSAAPADNQHFNSGPPARPDSSTLISFPIFQLFVAISRSSDPSPWKVWLRREAPPPKKNQIKKKKWNKMVGIIKWNEHRWQARLPAPSGARWSRRPGRPGRLGRLDVSMEIFVSRREIGLWWAAYCCAYHSSAENESRLNFIGEIV